MSEWIAVGGTDMFGEEDVFGVVADGTPVAVYRVEGKVYATHDICSHGQANLSDGWLEDGKIECPLHQGLFDVKTGEAVGAPCKEAVAIFPAKLEGDQVFVQIS